MGNRGILITGGAGFIGAHLAEHFCNDFHVVLLDNFWRGSLSLVPHLATHPNVRVISGDVLDPDSLRDAFSGIDVVLHLAAIAGVSHYYQEPLRTLHVNVLGTINVLEEAIKHNIQLFIYFSSSEVFGSNALWVDENSPHSIGSVSDLRWTYAASKLTGEHLSLRYAEKYGFACTIVRPFNIYGPRQVGEGAIGNFCRAVANRQPMTVYGGGSSIRAWCYVSDLVDAVQAILRAPRAVGEVFNIGNPQEVETTLGLTRRIACLVPYATVQYQEVDRSEIRARIPVIDKARKVLGFQPKVDLDQGLSRTLEWFMREGTSK